MEDNAPDQPPASERSEGRTYSAEEVRQGEIILRTPLRRWIFFGGLIGFVVLAVIVKIWGG